MAEQKIYTMWTDGQVNEDSISLLRTTCEDLPVPLSNEAQGMVQRMVETFLLRDDGVGLAAPQIGILKRIIVFRNKGFDQKTWSKKPEDYEVLINPRITQARGELVSALEGCLSCPDIQVEIARYPEIKLRAYDARGNKISKRYNDYAARVVQHEMDHLEGKLIIDHGGTLYYPKEKQLFFDRIFRASA
ncbi:MAG: peptide deformylase [Deltaproteobacteria bacterium]|nr:peptide deformylase [Deltaproteobacteria bacterium]